MQAQSFCHSGTAGVKSRSFEQQSILWGPYRCARPGARFRSRLVGPDLYHIPLHGRKPFAHRSRNEQRVSQSSHRSMRDTPLCCDMNGHAFYLPQPSKIGNTLPKLPGRCDSDKKVQRWKRTNVSRQEERFLPKCFHRVQGREVNCKTRGLALHS